MLSLSEVVASASGTVVASSAGKVVVSFSASFVVSATVVAVGSFSFVVCAFAANDTDEKAIIQTRIMANILVIDFMSLFSLDIINPLSACFCLGDAAFLRPLLQFV